MDDGTAMAAAVAQPRPSPPRAAGSGRGFFSFLKDGVLVTTRNRGLFLSLAALHAAQSLAMYAARIVVLRYLGPTLGLRVTQDGLRFSLFGLLDRLADGDWWLLRATAACYVVKVAIVLLRVAIKAATACAAVASCSNNASSIDVGPGRTTLTLASLFRRRNLCGPMATAVFVEVVLWASVVAWEQVMLAAVPAALGAYGCRPPAGLVYSAVYSAGLVYWLLVAATPFVFIYYFAARDVAVVVSVAEPGLRAGGALRRARRLTRGGKRVAQAMLHGLLSWALNKAVWRVHDVAMVAAATPLRLDSLVFWLDTVVLYMVVGAVKVLYTATVTAYYFDCKRTEEEKAAHVHMD